MMRYYDLKRNWGSNYKVVQPRAERMAQKFPEFTIDLSVLQ